MRPSGIKYLKVASVDDLLTVIDRPDTPASYAIESIGFRQSQEGMVCERDFGTKHRFADYPASLKILDAFPLYDKSTQTLYYIAVCQTGTTMSVWVKDLTRAADAYNLRGATTGGWFELTASLATTIHGTPSTTAVTIHATLATNEVQYWIAYNTTRSPAQAGFVVSSAAGTTTSVLTLDIDAQALGWAADDVVTLYRHSITAFGYTAAAGAIPHLRWLALEQLLKGNIYYGSATLATDAPTMKTPVQVLKKGATRNYFAYATSSFRRTLPVNWFLERGGGGLIPTFQEVGSSSTPQGASVSKTTTGTTGTIATWTGTTLTGSGTNFKTYLKTGAVIWQDVAVNAEYRQVTSIVSDTECTILSGFTADATTTWAYGNLQITKDITDGNASAWLQIVSDGAITLYSASSTSETWLKIAITVIYNGYQESDPIWRGNFAGYNSTPMANIEYENIIHIGLHVNFAKTNKNITGFRIYAAMSDSVKVADFSAWNTADTDYILMEEIPLDSLGVSTYGWVQENWNETMYRIPCRSIGKGRYDLEKATAASNLKANLGHAPVWATRAYLTPRFAISTARGGVGVVAVDGDDSTIRLSSYDGDGAHEDDNFPDLVVDNTNAKQKYLLQSLGEIVGLKEMNGKIYVVKPTELEICDLQSGLQDIMKVDCVARRGILSTRSGLFLPGRSGINLIPSDGGGVVIANANWVNRYDGTERLTDGTASRVSDSDRQGIIAGYNPIYQEEWFYLPTSDAAGGTSRKLCYRRSKNGKWFCREVGLGSTNVVSFFVTGTDNSFSIGFGHSADAAPNITNNGILKYPNLDEGANYPDTVSNYEDCVTSADATANLGITMKLLVNFGNLFGLMKNSVLWDFIISHVGTVKAGFTTGAYEIKLYINNEYGTTTFETKTHPITAYPFPRGLPPRGQVERVMMEINLNDTATNLAKIRDFRISGFEVGYLEQSRRGTT